MGYKLNSDMPACDDGARDDALDGARDSRDASDGPLDTGPVHECALHFFVLDSRRVLAGTVGTRQQRRWQETTSRIQMLRHVEKRGAMI